MNDSIFDSMLDDEHSPTSNSFNDDDEDFKGFCDSFFSQDNSAIVIEPKSTYSSFISSSSDKKKIIPVKKEKLLGTNKVTAKNKGGKKTRSPTKTKKSILYNNVSTITKKFRPYQSEKWRERYEDLLQFRKEHGHCLVPHTYPPNPILARWVKRQRYQYKLFQMKEQSSMTIGRIQQLQNIGFVWHSHEVVWQERLKDLIQFKSKYGHCIVPSNYNDNPKLATWVKCQRRQYKLHLRGSSSNITTKRIATLEKYGFEWQLRSSTITIEQEIVTHQRNLRLKKTKNMKHNDNKSMHNDNDTSSSNSSLERLSSKTKHNIDNNNLTTATTNTNLKDIIGSSCTSTSKNESSGKNMVDFSSFLTDLIDDDEQFSNDDDDDDAITITSLLTNFAESSELE